MNTISVWGKKLSLKSHKHVSMNRWKNAGGLLVQMAHKSIHTDFIML